VYQYFSIYNWYPILKFKHFFLKSHATFLKGTKDCFKWVKVSGTVPFWKAWNRQYLVLCQFNSHNCVCSLHLCEATQKSFWLLQFQPNWHTCLLMNRQSLSRYIVVCPFVLFLLAIVLSVLRYTDSDCPFGIFKLFLKAINTVLRKGKEFLLH
jgi:hypothetical protein